MHGIHLWEHFWCRLGCQLCTVPNMINLSSSPSLAKTKSWPSIMRLHSPSSCTSTRLRGILGRWLFLMFLRLGRWSTLRSSSKLTLRNASLKLRFMERVDWFFTISLARYVNTLTIARASSGVCVLSTVVDKIMITCYGCHTSIGSLLALLHFQYLLPFLLVQMDSKWPCSSRSWSPRFDVTKLISLAISYNNVTQFLLWELWTRSTSR